MTSIPYEPALFRHDEQAQSIGSISHVAAVMVADNNWLRLPERVVEPRLACCSCPVAFKGWLTFVNCKKRSRRCGGRKNRRAI